MNRSSSRFNAHRTTSVMRPGVFRINIDEQKAFDIINFNLTTQQDNRLIWNININKLNMKFFLFLMTLACLMVSLLSKIDYINSDFKYIIKIFINKSY